MSPFASPISRIHFVGAFESVLYLSPPLPDQGTPPESSSARPRPLTLSSGCVLRLDGPLSFGSSRASPSVPHPFDRVKQNSFFLSWNARRVFFFFFTIPYLKRIAFFPRDWLMASSRRRFCFLSALSFLFTFLICNPNSRSRPRCLF